MMDIQQYNSINYTQFFIFSNETLNQIIDHSKQNRKIKVSFYINQLYRIINFKKEKKHFRDESVNINN